MTTYPEVQRAKALTPAEVHQLMGQPIFIARRLQEFTDFSFLSDYLLKGSADATGTGSVLVEREGDQFLGGEPEVVAPDAEYPYINYGEVGADQIAINKRGFRHVITDEQVSRNSTDVMRKFNVLAANTIIRNFDSIGRAVIGSLTTDTITGSGWTDGKQIVRDVLRAAANREELERGISTTAVVLKPTAYAEVSAALVGANLLPRETGNPLLNGAKSFDYMGFTWVKSMYSPWTNPAVVDIENLGGVATETISSPEYARAQNGIEVSTQRTGRDGWEITVRRVGTPYVTAPKAAIQITGTGL